MNVSKFSLVICELYHESMHGSTQSEEVLSHYLVNQRFDEFPPMDCNLEEIYNDVEFEDDDEDLPEIYYAVKIHRIRYIMFASSQWFRKQPHHSVRNYHTIIEKQDYIQPQIAHCVYLPGGECVAILKTFWIRIVQRTWKKIYKQRLHIIQLRKQPSSLFYRETHGKWPISCNRLPGLNYIKSG